MKRSVKKRAKKLDEDGPPPDWKPSYPISWGTLKLMFSDRPNHIEPSDFPGKDDYTWDMTRGKDASKSRRR